MCVSKFRARVINCLSGMWNTRLASYMQEEPPNRGTAAGRDAHVCAFLWHSEFLTILIGSALFEIDIEILIASECVLIGQKNGRMGGKSICCGEQGQSNASTCVRYSETI